MIDPFWHPATTQAASDIIADDLADLLIEIEAFLASQSDVIDGDYGVPAPNKAMLLLSQVSELIGALERAPQLAAGV